MTKYTQILNSSDNRRQKNVKKTTKQGMHHNIKSIRSLEVLLFVFYIVNKTFIITNGHVINIVFFTDSKENNRKRLIQYKTLYSDG